MSKIWSSLQGLSFGEQLEACVMMLGQLWRFGQVHVADRRYQSWPDSCPKFGLLEATAALFRRELPRGVDPQDAFSNSLSWFEPEHRAIAVERLLPFARKCRYEALQDFLKTRRHEALIQPQGEQAAGH